jgi:SAM-dependent methyltransferase
MSSLEKTEDPSEIERKYERDWTRLNREVKEFDLFRERLIEPDVHPENFVDFECAFAAEHLRSAAPAQILDVGSYRHFILGLLAHYSITTLDVRPRTPIVKNETVITGDAKGLSFPDGSFDAVLSLCALEHFGLGRYGDEFDARADSRALAEMVRVLKPGGVLIFTTTITAAPPAIAFNAHKIYNHKMIKNFCSRLTCVNERFYSHRLKRFCTPIEITTQPKWWDVYCGCWKKP